MMRNVLIVGDSLSMPRVSDDLMITDTYGAKLQLNSKDIFVVNASVRGLNAKKINSADYLDEHVFSLCPDVVIIALGIVDCTPRIFTEFEYKVLSYLSKYSICNFFVSRFIALCSKHRLLITKYRNFSYLSADEFKQNIISFIDRVRSINSECEFVFINVLAPSQDFASRNFGFENKLDQYNKELASLCADNFGKLIDLYSYTKLNEKAVLDDGYHITALAHDFIYEELKKIDFEESERD